MAESPAKTLAGTSGPDRRVPERLIDIDVLAIRCGSHEVAIVHESMGGFHAPLGWILYIRRYDHHYSGIELDDDFTMLTHQVACDLDDLKAPEWVQVADAAGRNDEVVIVELLDLFKVGIRGGWDVTYTREQMDHHIMQRTMARLNKTDDFGMRHKLSAHASNWSWDEAARARGDQLSAEVKLSIREGANRDVVAFSTMDGAHNLIGQLEADQLIRALAPWAVAAGYFDTDREDWIL